jgi:uncharacterized protein YuzE
MENNMEIRPKDIDIDPINKVMYVRFNDGMTYKTIEHQSGDVLIDINRKGKLLGIEFLNLDIARSVLVELAKMYKIPAIKRIHPLEAQKVYA